jgi:hypothetical protein
VQHGIEDLPHAHRLAIDGAQTLFNRIRQVGVLDQHLGGTAHDRHRRAQFMADIGGEIAFPL